jgi:hypothetical protein
VAHGTGVRRLALVFALAASLASAAFAYNVTFSKVPGSPDFFVGPHADLNGDGREDFAFINYANGFDVFLSTGDGKWDEHWTYYLNCCGVPRMVLIGDFTGDGKPDIVVGGSEGAIHIFVNNGVTGPGRFTEHGGSYGGWPVSDYTTVAGDFNHDGRMDIAFVGQRALSVTAWFGNGKGGFTAGPTSPIPFPAGSGLCDNHLQMGDFDGDGRADLICDGIENSTAMVLYGDGTGHFPQHSAIHTSSPYSGFQIGDVDGDGKMDVLVEQGNPELKSISVRYGSAARTWTRTATIPTLHFVHGVAAADMNGDGINDLIVGEFTGSGPNPTYYLGVLLRNSNGSYQKEQTVLTGDQSIALDFVFRANRDTKPDLLLGPGPTGSEGFILFNTTAGNFPPCAAPNAFVGINVCSPAAGATVTSPVAFKVSAAGQVPMRDVEVWVDGKKVALQVDGFSNYTFLNRSLSLAAGTHNVAIFAAGWDQSLQKKTFTLKVK